MIELGGNIKLEGFHNVDAASLIIIKKIVGNYAKKMQEQSPSFQELTLLMNQTSNAINIQAQLKAEKTSNAQVSEANLFFAVDKALAELLAGM
jgi:hypothetical protein